MRHRFLDKLTQAGREFVNREYPVSPSRPFVSFTPNPHLVKMCPAYVRFLRMETTGLDVSKGFFAFHGTRAPKAVCWQGFDPSRRHVQQHGPGEYFSTKAATAECYSRDDGKSQLLLVFILKSSGALLREESTRRIFVVPNPIDWSQSYCLPVGVICTNPAAPPDFTCEEIMLPPCRLPNPDPDNIQSLDNLPQDLPPRPVSDPVEWIATPTVVFQWFWRRDEGHWEPYRQENNSLIELGYELYTRHNGPAECEAGSVKQLPGGETVAEYVVNFAEKGRIREGANVFGRQRPKDPNLHDDRSRAVKRVRVAVDPSPDAQWQYLEGGQWLLMQSDEINRAFEDYRAGGPGIIRITIKGRDDPYEVNLINPTQTQMNLRTRTTHTIRKVVRSQPGPAPVPAPATTAPCPPARVAPAPAIRRRRVPVPAATATSPSPMASADPATTPHHRSIVAPAASDSAATGGTRSPMTISYTPLRRRMAAPSATDSAATATPGPATAASAIPFPFYRDSSATSTDPAPAATTTPRRFRASSVATTERTCCVFATTSRLGFRDSSVATTEPAPTATTTPRFLERAPTATTSFRPSSVATTEPAPAATTTPRFLDFRPSSAAPDSVPPYYAATATPRRAVLRTRLAADTETPDFDAAPSPMVAPFSFLR
ncbi:hypothetical protein PAPYR_10033 [Paratrimastix pyriformis]|uniref:WWE domain-containing protein n=1 Tax=Paratrimastix pyriformis TaxID=342808 RepID=A0ABQ8UAN2_9EUKA|nr:hypothetical protein PAPYR_10033 [Paratrimastix pyriformis]